MKITGSITISRVHCSHSEDYISIRMDDNDAQATFVDAKLDLNSFALLLTGVGFIDCEIEVRGLGNVGKVKEQKEVSFELPEGTPFSEEKATAAAMLDEIDDGWSYSTYLGSQGSFYSDGDKRHFRTWAARWIDKDEAE